MSETVMIVDAAGITRVDLLDAGARDVLSRAAVPIECGPDIPVAPARGPMIRFSPREMVKTKDGGFVSKKSGYCGRDGVRVSDAFDRMTLQAQRAHQKKGEGAGIFQALFTPGQISAARDYAGLTERVAASGLKCSSLETSQGGGGRAGDREAALFHDIDRLRALHRRIGAGLAKEVRRIRPSERGGDKAKRSAIYVRRLVDDVCLGERTLSEVLKRHHWAVDAKAREGLRRALCAALERMQGYDLHKGG